MKYKHAITTLEDHLATWIKDCEAGGHDPRGFIASSITESLEAGIRLLKEASS